MGVDVAKVSCGTSDAYKDASWWTAATRRSSTGMEVEMEMKVMRLTSGHVDRCVELKL